MPPMIQHSGIRRQVWTKCDRCGFEYPVEKLTSQKGALLCPEDLDNLRIEERPMVIQEVLEDGEELLDVVGEYRAQDTEIPEL